MKEVEVRENAPGFRLSQGDVIALVFVIAAPLLIIALGVVAAVAVPRFATTRTDALVAMARSDIATILKSVPARVFAENLDTTEPRPNGYANWGEWIIDTAGLDKWHWRAVDSRIFSGIEPITQEKNGESVGCGVAIWIDSGGRLIFAPNNLSTDTKFCKALKTSYPSGSGRAISLATTGPIRF